MAVSARTKEPFEYFAEFSKQKSRKDKVEYLSKLNNVVSVRDICQGIFDDRIEWLIPTGPVPYTPSKEESYPSTLLRKNKDFLYFVKGSKGSKVPAIKRESIFLALIESIHPEDAKLVVAMVNKDTKAIPGLTKKIVQEAFPNLGIK